MRGQNWRNVLSEYAAISGVLAGFSVTGMIYILGSSIADYSIFNFITYGQISLMLFGVSTGLFITASELFLHAKTYDQYNIVERYRSKIDSDEEIPDTWEKDHIDQCRKDDESGRKCFNTAIFITFGGIFFLIAPYNITVALIVSIFGIGLQLWQKFRLKN